jgi:nucleotide-binding universal stress UspA family protein
MSSPDSGADPAAPILAAFDVHTAAREPVEFGLAASLLTTAPLVVVSVQAGAGRVRRVGATDEPPDHDAQALDAVRADLERRGAHGEVKVVEDDNVSHGLARAIEELRPELVVVGSTRRGAAGRVLLGSTAERVIHESECPVAVVPKDYARPEGGVQRIVAAFSPTPEGYEALKAAAALARARGAHLRAVTAHEQEREERSSQGLMATQRREIDPREADAARRRLDAEAALRDAVSEIAGDLEADIDVFTQDPADALESVSHHADLLVMGSRAYGPRRGVLLGSVSRRVAERAACPVIVLPRGATEMADRLLARVQAQGGREPAA